MWEISNRSASLCVANRQQRVAFGVDLTTRPEPAPTEYRNRRTPALEGVLEQNRRDHRGNDEEAAIASG